MKKLHGYQIKGKVHVWIKEFLKKRHQCIVINSTQCDKKEVLRFVPQGSVLCPVLFPIFINDLPDTIDASIEMFADNIKILKKN